MALIDNLRLIGSPDTNAVMMGELSRLSRRALQRRPPQPRKQGRGALIYPFDSALATLATRYHRTATRVLWDLYTSDATRLEPLYDDLVVDVAGDRRAWHRDGAGISVYARNVSQFAAGERQIVGTVKNAIIDGAAARGVALRVNPDAPDIQIVARMHDDRLTVSVDLVGSSMSQRGYRTSRGKAPLREHLAAALCMLARHDARSQALVDPMCGAGTICIEAALMARAAPLRPQHRRNDMMTRMSRFSPETDPASRVAGPLFADTRPVVIGNDADRGAIRAAQANGQAAGVSGDAIWRVGDFRALTRDRIGDLITERRADLDTGLILSNPPYGRRLDEARLRDLYRDLSDWCSQFRGWRAGFLVANRDWQDDFGRRPRIRKPIKNGPLTAYFYLYEL